MIERYCLSEMKNIWELEKKFSCYLEVELAICRAYNEFGEIPDEDYKNITEKAAFSISRIDEIEAQVHHDVIAFLTNVNENIGESSRYVHKGVTSSDIIDTALALQVKSANKIIDKDFQILFETLKQKAKEYKYTVCIGRSHGIHAEPMTFGVKILNWLDMFERNYEKFKQASKLIEVGQISGPVGTYSNIDPKIEKRVCEILDLTPARISTQVIARDIHAQYMQSLALIASVMEQCCIELRHLQRTEVNEVEESFGANQKGSSAMPHKKNPISAENLTGLARLVRSNSLAALENIALWHERDISHSSVERVIFPDSTILIDYMLTRFNKLIKNLVVKDKNMLKNTYLYGGIVYSQRVLLELCSKGISREEAYKLVQQNALSAFDGDGNFKENIMQDKKICLYLSKEEIENCFDINFYLRNIDAMFEKFNL